MPDPAGMGTFTPNRCALHESACKLNEQYPGSGSLPSSPDTTRFHLSGKSKQTIHFP